MLKQYYDHQRTRTLWVFGLTLFFITLIKMVLRVLFGDYIPLAFDGGLILFLAIAHILLMRGHINCAVNIIFYGIGLMFTGLLFATIQEVHLYIFLPIALMFYPYFIDSMKAKIIYYIFAPLTAFVSLGYQFLSYENIVMIHHGGLISWVNIIGAVILVIIVTHTHTELGKEKDVSLYQQASKDYLTQIPNRQTTEAMLARELAALAFGETQPFGVIYLDVDRFKLINDEYGHQIGDKVLIEVVNRVNQSLRKGSQIGRVGGEEFLILVPNASSEILDIVGKRVLSAVNETPFMIQDDPHNLTVSLGATMGHTTDTVLSLFDRSDLMMRQAKQQGRNCVVVDDQSHT